jgi:hypothetical protein
MCLHSDVLCGLAPQPIKLTQLSSACPGDVVHLIHVVSDDSMDAGSVPMWFGAYDDFTPFVMQSSLDASQQVVRPSPNPSSNPASGHASIPGP